MSSLVEIKKLDILNFIYPILYRCFVMILKPLKIFSLILNMNRKGDCWDNVVIESFFATLKKSKCTKLNLKHEYNLVGVFDYIEAYYNNERTHTHLAGYHLKNLNGIIEMRLGSNLLDKPSLDLANLTNLTVSLLGETPN